MLYGDSGGGHPWSGGSFAGESSGLGGDDRGAGVVFPGGGDQGEFVGGDGYAGQDDVGYGAECVEEETTSFQCEY